MKIHFLGIGGVGMAGLAVLLKGEGHAVDGCDLYDSARVQWLRGLGIHVATGHDAGHVASADLVIATPAVARDNPEFAAAARADKVRWRGDVLAELVSRRDAVAICGSHGKTTTATFVAKLLRALGEDVAWAIGGETGAFPVAGTGFGPLVVEADESDGTLANYRANMLVVTNCDYDHPDHFKTEADYRACYDAARRQANIVIEAGELPLEGWSLPIAGEHNRRNARAAIEVALRRGHDREAIARALPRVLAELPDRRFQKLAPGVYTDYAHHPTEMKCAIAMAREACTGVLRVIFQPHRYSRTRALLSDFAAAFDQADEVVLCPTYAAFEPLREGGTVEDLYARMRGSGRGGRLMLARSCAEAWRHAALEMLPGDVTLLLGAGDIIKLAPRIVQEPPRFLPRPKRPLAAYSFFGTGGCTVGGGARRFVGQGSNIWISDLTTDEEYVRTTGPAARLGASLGIPWMAGVPGTIGGWLKMNAGAFGHAIGELVVRVKVDGCWREREACRFGYRTSALEGEIQDVVFDETALKAQTGTCEEYRRRRKTFPARCCGSVFKNPPDDFAGRLLEQAGAKGMRIGGAYVWPEHANVIAAGDGATSSDILALAELLRVRVLLRFGVLLEYEITGLDAV